MPTATSTCLPTLHSAGADCLQESKSIASLNTCFSCLHWRCISTVSLMKANCPFLALRQVERMMPVGVGTRGWKQMEPDCNQLSIAEEVNCKLPHIAPSDLHFLCPNPSSPKPLQASWQVFSLPLCDLLPACLHTATE